MALIGGGFFSYLKSRKPKVTYTTAEVQKTNLFQTVSTTGTLNPEKQYDLAFKASGRVTQMLIDVGDSVKKGQKLAQVDKGTLFSDLKQAQEEVKAQKRALNNMERRRGTYNLPQMSAQKAEVRKAEAAVSAIYEQFNETILYSPIDGTVIKRNINEGEVTFANGLSTAVALTIAPVGDLIIESNIPESDIVKVQVGQKADVTFDALTADEKFGAEVIEIDPASTVIQDVVDYKVKFKLANQDSRLKIGMSNDIDVRTAERNNVIVIPLRAIKTDGEKKYVEILKDEKNNLIDKVFVTTGLTGDDGMVEITSGLKGGEKVITLTK